MVGSWPRPMELSRAQHLERRGDLSEIDCDRIADQAVVDLLRCQEDLGLDIVTDGELRRDNFYSFVADRLSGVVSMTLAEMLDLVHDKAAFEQLLQTLDVPAYSISNPVCVGRVARRQPLALPELRFVQRHTTRPVKVPLPGPYLMTRAMFVPEVTRQAYPTKEDLAEDVVTLLREEIGDLIANGADFIQLDEPVLTELVFTQGRTRTFMCAALAARKDPAEELELAASLINRVVDGWEGARIGLHVCRGNWSPDESTLLRGSYDPLKPFFERLRVQQLVLEYATDRAGDLMRFAGKELGLGVVNPRSSHVESADEIRRSVERALRLYPPDKLFLNPDCGFGTFSNRPVNTEDIARRKLQSMVEAARAMRTTFPPSGPAAHTASP
ncbi:MAG: vitamin-B12 independent methionine synthase [Luteitalea sp.]|nr:vitamin-B12 independent methionine synthase [Luteitalea sp.]